MTRTPSLARDEAGATLVEFALVLAPLLAVVLGFTELAYQSYVRSILQGVLNDVARIAVVENPNLGDASNPLEMRIENRVRERMAPLVKSATYAFDIRSYNDYASAGNPEALVTDVNGNGSYDSGDCWEDSNPNGTFDLDSGRSGVGGADDVVIYRVTLTAPQLLPAMPFVGGDGRFDARAVTTVRIQPYDEQRKPEVVC